MVQQADIHQFQGRSDPLCDALISLAGLGHARWVIVSQDNRRGIHFQRLLHDFAGINAGAIDRAAEQLFEQDDPVPVIEVDTSENLMGPVSQPRQQERLCVCRAADRLANGQGFFKIAASQLAQGGQGYALPYTFCLAVSSRPARHLCASSSLT